MSLHLIVYLAYWAFEDISKSSISGNSSIKYWSLFAQAFISVVSLGWALEHWVLTLASLVPINTTFTWSYIFVFTQAEGLVKCKRAANISNIPKTWAIELPILETSWEGGTWANLLSKVLLVLTKSVHWTSQYGYLTFELSFVQTTCTICGIITSALVLSKIEVTYEIIVKSCAIARLIKSLIFALA